MNAKTYNSVKENLKTVAILVTTYLSMMTLIGVCGYLMN